MLDLINRLRSPRGGVVADTQIVDAARVAADEIDRMHLALSEILEAKDLEGAKARALIALPSE